MIPLRKTTPFVPQAQNPRPPRTNNPRLPRADNPRNHRAPRTLIADDEQDILTALRILLANAGHELEAVSSPAAVLEAIKRSQFDVVLMDLNYARDTTSGREGLDLVKSAAQAKAAPGFGDAPLVVLTAGDRAAVTEGLPADLAATFDDIWMDLQSDLVKLSTSGRQEIVPDATHDMPFEQPGVIVDAIREVLAEAG